MAKKAAVRRPAPDVEGPTPERLSHGPVERIERAVADEAGRPARPFRAADTLLLMLRRHSISAPMYQAAEDFRALFHRASLAPLGVSDPGRTRDGPRPGATPLSLRRVEARDRVWSALAALGGVASPAGSCVWHIVGCEWSVKDWAAHRGWGGRPLSPETAAGVLIGALGMLESHFRLGSGAPPASRGAGARGEAGRGGAIIPAR